MPSPQGLGLPPPSLDPKPSNKTIVIWGASSAVGLQSTQVATAAGVKVVAVASAHNFEVCRTCGAEEVFDYHSASVVNDVVKAVRAGGGEFAGMLECISLPESLVHSVSILEQLGGGPLGVLLPHANPVVSNRVDVVHILGMGAFTDTFWEQYITPALQQGTLKCLPEPMIVGHGLESLQKAVDVLRAGVSARKVVVTL
jgi:NADPH:quinone reductase-like Zn-dependent oxidoreductase